eukprot:scaffold121212_cov33-Tisochrysis_lutea.AAC.2
MPSSGGRVSQHDRQPLGVFTMSTTRSGTLKLASPQMGGLHGRLESKLSTSELESAVAAFIPEDEQVAVENH